MIYQIEFSEKAEDDIEKHMKAGNRMILKKVSRLLDELKVNPCYGTGISKPLRHSNEKIWSRRLNQCHRLIYEIKETKVMILSLWGHYDDK